MKVENLTSMIKGWFVGDFEPSVLKTSDVEVGVKYYRAGDNEPLHHHKVATEITCVISGEVEMKGQTFRAGDIIVLEPGEASSFRALTDCINVVVKHPSVANDKFLGSH